MQEEQAIMQIESLIAAAEARIDRLINGGPRHFLSESPRYIAPDEYGPIQE